MELANSLSYLLIRKHYIRSLVRLEICELDHNAYILVKVALALFILPSTSSSASPSVVIEQKLSTNSTGHPSSKIWLALLWLILKAFVLFILISKPTARASVTRRSAFACMSESLCESRQMSSAKSRSSRCLVKLHIMPFFCRVNWLKISSRTMARRSGDSVLRLS